MITIPKDKLTSIKPLLLLVLLILGLVLASCRTGLGALPRGWSGSVTDNGTLFIGSMDGRLVAVNTEDGKRIWSTPLEAEKSGGGGLFGCTQTGATTVAIYGTPSVEGDLVYIGGYNGKIYAFSRTEFRDEPRWVYPRQSEIPASIVGGTLADKGKLYFGSADGKVYALNDADGYKEWEFETGDKIWSTPAVDGDTLYISSFDNLLYALDTSDGRKKWEFATEGAIVATPIIDGNIVYIGSFDRYLYALNTADGSVRWKFMAENWFWSQPVVHDGVIYASNLDGKVYVLDASNGEKKMEFDLKTPITSSVMLGDKLVVATTETSVKRSVVYTLGIASNQQEALISFEEKIQAPIAAGQGKVYIHTDSGALYEIDVESGAKREFDIIQKNN
ncbi:PQQ-binding-like beta-propeller repeat protein [Chloroflexota bacterium]